MSNDTTISIPLTQGYVTTIDQIDLEVVTKKMQVRINKTSGPYALKNIRTPAGYRPARLHRIIMERMLGRQLLLNELVDHIDGDGLNNCRANLRLANHSLNGRNAKLRRDNKVGLKGVCWSKPAKRWRAYGKMNGKQVHLGYFDTPEEAHEAYQKYALANYGEFARLK